MISQTASMSIILYQIPDIWDAPEVDIKYFVLQWRQLPPNIMSTYNPLHQPLTANMVDDKMQKNSIATVVHRMHY